MEMNLWYFHKKSNSVIINHARKKKVKKISVSPTFRQASSSNNRNQTGKRKPEIKRRKPPDHGGEKCRAPDIRNLIGQTGATVII